MKLLIDVAPLDAEAREVIVAAWTEIFRAELAARRAVLSPAAIDRSDPDAAPARVLEVGR